jgi:hypothetical protein
MVNSPSIRRGPLSATETLAGITLMLTDAMLTDAMPADAPDPIMIFMRTVAGILAAALALSAQTAPETDLLKRIRAHMVETLRRQPNYTCLETVERSQHDSRNRVFEKRDTVRLEVALVDHREMFAWPGSKNFEDKPVTEFVPGGMFGNGDFATYASTVFGSSGTQFRYVGPANGSVRFDFQVGSGLQLMVGGEHAVVGYHGSFYADPKSLDVNRLEVIVDDIPSPLRLLRALDTLEYARVRIGDADFLLPSAGEVVMTHSNGAEDRNYVKFSTCHEFSGESVLTFDEPGLDGGAKPNVERQEVTLPRNLPIVLRLLDQIDTETAGVGDALRAELAAEIKVKGHILFAQGTPVNGRITKLQSQGGSTTLGLIFLELESASAHARMELEFERMDGPRALILRQGRPPAGARERHEGVIVLRPGRVRLARGTLVYWRT